jgi:hypothetical protein
MRIEINRSFNRLKMFFFSKDNDEDLYGVIVRCWNEEDELRSDIYLFVYTKV